MGASGVDPLPWSWRECTLLNVCEAYEFCLTLRAPRSEVSRATLRRQGRVDFYVSVRDAHKSPSLPPHPTTGGYGFMPDSGANPTNRDYA